MFDLRADRVAVAIIAVQLHAMKKSGGQAILPVRTDKIVCPPLSADVEEKDSVRKGDVLAIIRADDIRAALAEAKVKLALDEPTPVEVVTSPGAAHHE